MHPIFAKFFRKRKKGEGASLHFPVYFGELENGDLTAFSILQGVLYFRRYKRNLRHRKSLARVGCVATRHPAQLMYDLLMHRKHVSAWVVPPKFHRHRTVQRSIHIP